MILKTGAIIYLPQYERYHNADVYQVGNTFIFIAARPRYERPSTPHHAEFTLSKDTFDRSITGNDYIFVVPIASVWVRRAWHSHLDLRRLETETETE